MAVINPPPHRETREVWKPTSNLEFDGAKASLEPKRFESKNIPEHLVRPPIDELTLMKIKEMAKTS